MILRFVGRRGKLSPSVKVMTFVGPDQDHLTLTGYLAFTELEWEQLKAGVSSGRLAGRVIWEIMEENDERRTR